MVILVLYTMETILVVYQVKAILELEQKKIKKNT